MTSDPTKPLSPPGLANQLFETSLLQCKGDALAASMLVMRFLTEALVFTISAAAGDDETARKGLLKSVSDAIAVHAIAQPQPPPDKP